LTIIILSLVFILIVAFLGLSGVIKVLAALAAVIISLVAIYLFFTKPDNCDSNWFWWITLILSFINLIFGAIGALRKTGSRDS
jgi:hypothetical protein